MFGNQEQQNLPAGTEQTTAMANEKGQQSFLSIMMNVPLMQNINQLATIMSEGTIATPQHFRGKHADCLAVCLQAMQWGMNPFPVMQKTHMVNGVLGYEAQLVNAVVVNSGAIKGRFSYRKFGPWESVLGKFAVRESNKDGKKSTYRVPDWKPQDEEGCGVEITAVLAGGKTESIELMLTQARTRNSTLWADDPYQQLCYLGVKRWVRLYTPDVIMGVYTIDELQEDERELNPIAEKPQQASMEERMAARRAQMKQQADEVVVNEQDFDTNTGEVHQQPEQKPDPQPEQDQGINPVEELTVFIGECTTLEELGSLGAEIAKMKELSDQEQADIRSAYKQRADAIRKSNKQ